MRKFVFSFLLFLYVIFISHSENRSIDSLLSLVNGSKDDTNKVNYFVDLSWEYKLAGLYDSALYYANSSLSLSQKLNYKSGISESCGKIGSVYDLQGNYAKSLEFYLRALRIAEEINDKKGIAVLLGNIGVVYDGQENFTKALEYYLSALKMDEELGNRNSVARHFSNIGGVYHSQKNYEKALEYSFKALKISEEMGDKNKIATRLGNIGIIYADQKNFSKALEYYFKSLKIKEELGKKSSILITYGNIGSTYAQLNNFSEAEKYMLKALILAKNIGYKDAMKNWSFSLSELYASKKDFKKAFEYHQYYSQVKDSLFNEESNKQITEMQTKYDTEKKEQQIKLLNKDKEIQTKDLARQKTIRNAVAGGLFLVLLFSFVLINRLLLIRKQKKVIEIEREKSEKLLLNILPKETADELKHKNTVTPKHYDMVTVMFTDFKGFTTIAEKMSAEELVSELDFIFKKFDEIISKYPIEKIKTIGDAYMCAGGLPVTNTTNALDVVMAALEIQEWMKSQNKWQLRLGIHTGSVIAGVVGDKKFAYDIWGDTVNTASRMESSGEAGKVNISGTTYQLLAGTRYVVSLRFTFRGKIPAKNKGEIEMYFVERKD